MWSAKCVVSWAVVTSNRLVREPVVRSREVLPTGIRLALEVPANLAWFSGHFPGNPVLPGVVQVGWAVAFAREHFGFAADPPHLDRVKFQRPIQPGVCLDLELTRSAADARRVSWRLSEAGNPVSSGRMEFSETSK